MDDGGWRMLDGGWSVEDGCCWLEAGGWRNSARVMFNVGRIACLQDCCRASDNLCMISVDFVVDFCRMSVLMSMRCLEHC